MPLRSISWRGSLFSSAAIREIGYPRTDYFLYGDDLEYSFRLAKAGYECFWVPLSVCDERRSSNKLRINVSGHEFRIYATPFRHYYAVRNELHAALYHRRMLHAARVIAYAGKVAATLVLTRKCGSGATISALYAGLVHGMTGRLGRNPRYTPDSKIV